MVNISRIYPDILDISIHLDLNSGYIYPARTFFQDIFGYYFIRVWLCVVPVGLPVGPARRVPNPVSCACVVFPTGPPPASAILRGLACRFLQGGVNACAGVNGHFWVSSISRQVLQVLSASFAGKRRADRRPQNLRANLQNLPARRFCPSSSRGFCLLSRVFLTY